MKTILVTGGTGFLGSNLCARLISEGNRVICVDNNYTGRLSNVAELMNNPNFPTKKVGRRKVVSLTSFVVWQFNNK